MGTAISVDINRLVLGRELDCPIHSTSGVLLVGAGQQITAELKAKLLARGVTSVMIDEEAAGRMTLDGIDAGNLEELDGKLNERIEEFIASGQMKVRNEGPALAKSVVHHGKKAYDPATTSALSDTHTKNVKATSDVIDRVSSGEEVELGVLQSIADSGIGNLAGDFASTLVTTFNASSNQHLAEHSIRMATLGMALGIEMGLDIKNVQITGISGLLADLGMAAVPEELRNANRKLTEIEFVEIQKHPIRTANLLERLEGLPRMVQIVAYQIHERPDGSGYPRKRTIKNIHPFARILNVADSYTAMTSTRADRASLVPYCAVESLVRQVQTHKSDAGAVRALLQTLSLFPIGSFVGLSDGSAARVLRANRNHFSSPIVARLTDARGDAIDPDGDDVIIDLAESELTVIQALPAPGSDEQVVDPRARRDRARQLDERVPA